jgi:hypothetical protein
VEKNSRPELQKILEKRHYPFKIQTGRITLADGQAEWRTIKTTTFPVTLKRHTFETPFICTSQGSDAAAVTLLRIDVASKFPTPSQTQERSRRCHNHTVDEAIEIMQSNDWSKLKNNYGPILSPLPPTPPRVRAPEIPVPMRSTHGPSDGPILIRSQFVWADAEHVIETMWFEQRNQFRPTPRRRRANTFSRLAEKNQGLDSRKHRPICKTRTANATGRTSNYYRRTSPDRESSVSNFTATHSGANGLFHWTKLEKRRSKF